jgi:RNA polymerase sigma factor (sigma-70 family)
MQLTPEQCQMVLDNLRLAKYVANKFNINRDYDHEEVLAVSYYALTLSAFIYSPAMEQKFYSFAWRNINRYLYREFMYQYKTKPMESYLEELALDLDGEASNWESYFGIESPEGELTDRLSAEQFILKINKENPGKGKAKTRAVVNLLYFYPYLTQQEVAEILGCSQKNVSLILKNIRKKHRQELVI